MRGVGKGAEGIRKKKKAKREGVWGCTASASRMMKEGCLQNLLRKGRRGGGGLFLCIDVNKLSVRIKGYAKLATHTHQAIMLLQDLLCVRSYRDKQVSSNIHPRRIDTSSSSNDVFSSSTSSPSSFFPPVCRSFRSRFHLHRQIINNASPNQQSLWGGCNGVVVGGGFTSFISKVSPKKSNQRAPKILHNARPIIIIQLQSERG